VYNTLITLAITALSHLVEFDDAGGVAFAGNLNSKSFFTLLSSLKYYLSLYCIGIWLIYELLHSVVSILHIYSVFLR